MSSSPDALSIDAGTTALVLIDLEHGIVSRELAPYGGADVVKRSAQLAAALRSAGGLVVYVHVLLHEALRLPADRPMPTPSSPPPPELSELVPEAGYQAGADVLVVKRQWDAFYATHLEQALLRRGIKTIIMAGIATNLGVESTARSAQARGYELVFAEDAMSTVSAEMQRFATEQIFPLMGRVRSTDQIVDALS